MKSVLFIIQTDPYASSTVSDAIDMAYAAAVFDVDVAVLFVGDGIACLRQGHDSKVLQRKSIEKKIAALPMYGVERLYYAGDSHRHAVGTLGDDAVSLNAAEQVTLFAEFQEIQVY